jgi:hypothetical protein
VAQDAKPIAHKKARIRSQPQEIALATAVLSYCRVTNPGLWTDIATDEIEDGRTRTPRMDYPQELVVEDGSSHLHFTATRPQSRSGTASPGQSSNHHKEHENGSFKPTNFRPP